MAIKIPTPQKKEYTNIIIKLAPRYGGGQQLQLVYFNEFKTSVDGDESYVYLLGNTYEEYDLAMEGGQCEGFVHATDKELGDYYFRDIEIKEFTNSSQVYNIMNPRDKKKITLGSNEDGWQFIKDNSRGCDIETPPPTPEPPTPEGPTEGAGTSCPTSGIYGGYGQKLTDIKLFLYANNVTAGTIKLNKPQLEVGTVATDWRPNADEAIKHYTPAYKQVKGLGIQQGPDGKKYLEIPTVEGTIYGADLWGGDTAKLLKDEIAELKEQIKELKNQIK